MISPLSKPRALLCANARRITEVQEPETATGRHCMPAVVVFSSYQIGGSVARVRIVGWRRIYV